MQRLTNNPPCIKCKADRQIGNPYYWQTECYNCEKHSRWKSEMYLRLEMIEDILGDEYELEGLKKEE